MKKNKPDQSRSEKLNLIHAIKKGKREDVLNAISIINAPKLQSPPIFITRDNGKTWKGCIHFANGEKQVIDGMEAVEFEKLRSDLKVKYNLKTETISIKRETIGRRI